MRKHLLLLGFALVAAPVLYPQDVVGNLFSGDASVRGSVLLSESGTRILSGSQISAGEATAVLKLERGGQVRICPKTNLSLSADPSGKSLVLGLNAGAMEVDYALRSSSDLLITPDFRLQLISPGTFHLAISVSPTGDTCMRSLAGNDASVFVAEMMGNDSYQLSPGKDVMFKAGKISEATAGPPNCGCPLGQPVQQLMEASRSPSALAPADMPAQPNPLPAHMEVDSTFVFRGNDSASTDNYIAVAKLSMSTDNSKLALALLPRVSAPASTVQATTKKPGILHRFGKFLGRVFGR